MEIISTSVSGIKCDTPECDYANMEVQYVDYPNWLNRECPNCGNNLLTEKDFNALNRMLRIISFVNNLGKFRKDKGEKRVKVRAEMNGTGRIKLTDGEFIEEETKNV